MNLFIIGYFPPCYESQFKFVFPGTCKFSVRFVVFVVFMQRGKGKTVNPIQPVKNWAIAMQWQQMMDVSK